MNQNHRARPWQTASRWCSGIAPVWLAVTASFIVVDSIHQLPPRKPTTAERAAATPGAESRWRTVSTQMGQRLTYHPPEYGAVWSSRSGRICGVVTHLNAGVFSRERFYTDGEALFFARDDGRRFLRA